MSADLHTLIRQAGDEAVSAHSPAPVDTAELWKRGRRQRTARRAAPVMAVLAVVGMGTAAIATAYGSDILDPLTSEDSAPLPQQDGWTDVHLIKGIDAAELPNTPLDDDSAPIVASLQTGTWSSTPPFDVDEEGSLVWVDGERGIVVQPAGTDAATVVGMPTPFLAHDGQWVVYTVQWGPDGRIYLTGEDPGSTGPRQGLTQIAVVERDGTLVGVRDNDALQDSRLLFADGFAWQQQRSEVMHEDGTVERTVPEGQQRWQALAEVGGEILQMPDQRASEVIGVTAPDGIAATAETLDGRHAGVSRLRIEIQMGDELHTREVRSVGWGLYSDPQRDGYRVWGGHAATRSWWGELTGSQQPMGGLLVITDGEGRTSALRNEGLLDEIGSSGAVIGGDGHLYLADMTDGETIDVRRYVHRLPGADGS